MLITAALDAAGLGLVMPILPTLLDQIGAPDDMIPLHVGLLTALYAVMQFLCAPILGKLSDRFGRRRVLVASLAGATIDYLVLALTSTLWVFYLVRAVAGVTGATNAVTATVIADITPPDQRAKRYGWLGACYGGGMIAGPAIGGFFGGISPHLPFLVAAALTGIILALSLSLLRDTRPQGGDGTVAPDPSTAKLTAAPGMLLLLAVFGMVQFIGQAPGSSWVLFTQQRLDWSPVEVGVSLSIFGLVQVFVQAALTGRIVSRVGETRAILVGIVADAVGLIGLALIINAWAMLPILAALGLGGITMPALQTLLSGRVPDQRQGHLQGTLASLNSLTSIIGPVTFTGIFALTRMGADGTLWLCAAALYVPCALLMIREAYASRGYR
ncbi:Tet(A)/Tet(B)/Tet(C) family tetracycline efflux MFS transporter [Propionimicrobium sp. PCR01-08-3]|uniref:Tet(A)/Tet(B)/Tet(C) family tetracycline efflux MFS transporter n=1 Tax=Propionimicrobium sp. PCR01-08-3 TaxID=3052086 RepID=UPI00255CAA7D|nr:Tet(A)/Tet(B)/Tet(C) family tetracycline efflux MFS transporter [Propionimicrobium sp. PCR01-08-3]WIY84261.1 Tet(A)/Tet(B)/Tet(C) family tetracycline efflux MFS transporter [Propionimicrobium sp. PCR01-08-3]